MKHPKISVIMSVRNAQKYLTKAIESILSQTYENFEFIIIDDDSTDKSLQILEEYALKDKRIKILTQANKGMIVALNKGLEIASGDYVARMDADDISLPERFEKQTQYLEKHSECVAVGCKILLIDRSDMPIMHFHYKQSHEEIDGHHMSGQGSAISHPAAMIRKKTLLEIGGYKPEFEAAEDIDLFLRLAEIGKLANLPNLLFKYRMHMKSVGHAKRKLQIKNAQHALEEAYYRRKIKERVPMIRRKITQTILDTYIKWAWWALRGRNIKTARKYAFLSLLRAPFSIETWKLMACCLRDF